MNETAKRILEAAAIATLVKVGEKVAEALVDNANDDHKEKKKKKREAAE